jgi:drug/metabolite transporter (DMT)-like permease
LTGPLYILSAIFLWSSLGIIIRLSGLSIQSLIFYSCLVSVIIQGIIIFFKGHKKLMPDMKRLKYPAMLGFVSFLNTFSFFYAYKSTTIANAVLTHYTAPVFVAVLAPFFIKEKITKKIIFVIAVASAGLWIMLKGISLEQGQIVGIMAGLFSGLAYAVIVILARIYSQGFAPVVLSFVTNLVVAVLVLPFVREFPFNALPAVLFVGLVHSTIAPILYYRGLRKVTANRAAVLGYLEPVSAIILGAIFLGEYIYWYTIAGGILIILSGYLVVRKG